MKLRLVALVLFSSATLLGCGGTEEVVDAPTAPAESEAVQAASTCTFTRSCWDMAGYACTGPAKECCWNESTSGACRCRGDGWYCI